MEAVTSPARARAGARSSALVQTVDIETPELVTFSYTITYFTKDGSPHPGATGTSTRPRVIVAAYHP